MPTTEQAKLKDLSGKIAGNVATFLAASTVGNPAVRSSLIKLLTATSSKVESAAKKAKNAQSKSSGSGSPPGGAKGQTALAGWQSDCEALIQFLLDTQTLVKFLVEHRIPSVQRTKFSACLKDMDSAVTASITSLRQINSESHSIYKALAESGMTGPNLGLKLSALRDAFSSTSVLTALGIARRILGSLGRLNPLIELFKELIETIEDRLKRSPDDEIIKLNLFAKLPA
jgi:hypothetical protein